MRIKIHAFPMHCTLPTSTCSEVLQSLPFSLILPYNASAAAINAPIPTTTLPAAPVGVELALALPPAVVAFAEVAGVAVVLREEGTVMVPVGEMMELTTLPDPVAEA
jgi:hypothetical protein